MIWNNMFKKKMKKNNHIINNKKISQLQRIFNKKITKKLFQFIKRNRLLNYLILILENQIKIDLEIILNK